MPGNKLRVEANGILSAPSIRLAICLYGISLSAHAAAADAFSPYVFASVTHDSNLLRLDSVTAAGTSTADTIRQGGVGVNMNWNVSRQQILATATVSESRFVRNSMLDYRGRDVHGVWNWRLADHLSGDAGYAYSLAIGGFANQQTLVRNLRVAERAFFDGLWLIHPSWEVGVGASKNKLTFPDATQSFLDRVEDVGETSVQYVSSANNKAGIKLRETNGHYPGQAVDFVNLLGSGYRQREVLATVDWGNGAHSEFHGTGGTVRRRQDLFAARNYDDINARGTYIWSPTGHLRLTLSAWREIWAYDDLLSSYSRNRGVGLEPRWTPYPTITVSASINRERRDFLGNPGMVPLAVARRDRLLTRSLAIIYQPAPSFSLKVDMGDDRRDSNQAFLSYYSRMVGVTATLHM